MKIKMTKYLGATLVLFFAMLSFANDKYASAAFDFSADQLASKLMAENVFSADGGSAVLYCQSDVSAAGVIARTNCYDKQGHDALAHTAERALAELMFTPAKVNDEAVPVRVSYRVGVSASEGGNVNIILIPNLGTMQDRYGRDYVAPQERLDVSGWYDRYSKASWVNGDVFLGDGALSRVAATVNENGKTELVRTLDDKRAYKRDAVIVKNAVKKSRFIPGFVDGRAVPMGYLAVVNYGGNSGEAVSAR
ncbi:MAG: hypothetical protein K6L81_17055 [Agarilytica sp.]